MELISNEWGNTTVVEGLRQLFDVDGTVYVVSGYFTNGGYRVIRPAIERFLSRSPENELVVIVTPAADQFNPEIARDLLDLDDDGQIQLYKYPSGCLHAKLYLRTGDDPAAIVGSVNLTRVAFEQNVELSVGIDTDGDDEDDIAAIEEWVDQLLTVSEPLRRRDLYSPMMVLRTANTWVNKARLLPRESVVRQPGVYLLLALIGSYLLLTFISA